MSDKLQFVVSVPIRDVSLIIKAMRCSLVFVSVRL